MLIFPVHKPNFLTLLKVCGAALGTRSTSIVLALTTIDTAGALGDELNSSLWTAQAAEELVSCVTCLTCCGNLASVMT